MSFSGKHDRQDSRNYIHYFNCLKEQFLNLHIANVCSNYSVWKVLLHLYKFFFKTSVFLVDYSKLVYQLPMNYLKLQSRLFN